MNPVRASDMESATLQFDPTRPNIARIYDYFLGGKDHYPADREQAEKIIEVAPYVPRLAMANRAFLGRVVRYLAEEAGVRQFLDIGSGLPTAQNVHEVAQEIIPTARVVYVDHDPLVLVHARALLATTPTTHVISADLRDSGKILGEASAHRFICHPR